MTLLADACRSARRALAALRDGELVHREHLALERHLAGCDACRAYATEFDAALGALREIPASLPFPDDALEEIWDRTLRAPRMEGAGPHRAAPPNAPRRPRRRWEAAAWTAAAAAAVLLAAVIGPYLALRGAGPVAPAATAVTLSPEEQRAAADLKLVLQLTDRALDRSRRAAIEGVLRRGVDRAMRLQRVPWLRNVVGATRDADGSGEVLR